MKTRDDYKQMQRDIDAAQRLLLGLLTDLYDAKKNDPRVRLVHDHLRSAVRSCDDAHLLLTEVLYG